MSKIRLKPSGASPWFLVGSILHESAACPNSGRVNPDGGTTIMNFLSVLIGLPVANKAEKS
jgi:hypothetical protein